MSKKSQRLVSLFLLFPLTMGGVILARETVTIGEVPINIVWKFLGDEKARNAYLKRNKRELHDRLEAMGIEEDIKAFYRPKIQDEARLDQYIHQIFYHDTGYVGDGYYVNSQGILILRQPISNEFNQWFKLAYKAGVVTGSRQENGVIYVISQKGEVAPYKEIAAIFPVELLRSLTEVQVKH